MPLMSKPVATDPQRRAEALRIAAKHGAAEASRRTGVPAATIRSWKSRDAQLAFKPPEGVDEVEWLRRAAVKTRDAVEAAIERLAEILPTARNARDVAIAAGVSIDKLEQLSRIVREVEDRQVRLSQTEGELVAAVIGQLLEAFGVHDLPVTARLVRGLLTQAASGATIVVAPTDSDEARRAVRQRIAAELRAEIERELHERIAPQIAETRGLPAPGDGGHSIEEPMAGPRRVVRTTDEVVSGELVEEPPRRRERPQQESVYGTARLVTRRRGGVGVHSVGPRPPLPGR
jgi:hypothetical protein